MVIHYKKNKSETACGNFIHKNGTQEEELTLDCDDVTCKACLRTKILKTKFAVQKGDE